MSTMGDSIEGVSGRWTLFTQLMNLNSELDSFRTPATIFAIDSVEENRLGVGRNFAPKKRIGKREVIVSSHLLKQLNV